jgi:NADH:ubiquinone oxidoreductase subunit 5 (subunit L)/multisubunit Na+/H+ antiporter MnhA subunit
MLQDNQLALIAAAVLGLPAATFLGLGGFMFLVRVPSERFIARLTASVFVLSLIGSLITLGSVLAGPQQMLKIYIGRWFELPGYAFEVTLVIDRLTATFMVLTTAIIGLVGRFSQTYLHRERGYARFFLLMHLFATGMLLLVMAGSVDMMFAGWEFVGLTSVLLIGFFDERNGPVRSGLRAFITYRVCDACLLMGVVLVHHYAHTAQVDLALGAGQWPLGASHLGQGPATIIAILFTLGAIGKSAQFPVSNWLPRAMEGPTPSSALFYGAMSVHAGVYLLLRSAPVFEAAPAARVMLVVVGTLSAIYATLVGRTQNDAKNGLAYATVTQVGLLFIEIGLGLHVLAVVHMIGHACLRTFQYLKAPSALHEANILHAAAGAHLTTGGHIESMLPARAQRWLYGLALARFHVDQVLDGVAHAVLGLARRLDVLNRYFGALYGSVPADRASAAPAPEPEPDPASKPFDAKMVRSARS